MSKSLESLQAINSFIRTILALVVVGGAGTAGWYGYNIYNEGERAEQHLADARKDIQAKQAVIDEQQQTITVQTDEIEEKDREIQRLDIALRMHKMQRRLARIAVLDVEEDAASGETFAVIEFTELNDTGDPIGEPKQFRLKGDLIYVDCLVVKFDDKYVEQADMERGTSICMFNRIFGEFQQPSEGFSLDKPGQQPNAYDRGGRISELEKQIWADFWSIANDPEKSAEMGIRTLHGDAVSIKVIKGKAYHIFVRASGGPEIEVEENGQPVTTPGFYS